MDVKVWLFTHTHQNIVIIDVLQNEIRYDFRKGPREISAGTEFTVFTVIKG